MFDRRYPVEGETKRRLASILVLSSAILLIMLVSAPPALAAICDNTPASDLDVTMAASEALTFTVGTSNEIRVNGNDTDSTL
jgi:hypothetical protein